MLHRMMAAVSPSSWLSHMGCGQRNDLLSGSCVIWLFSTSVALPVLNVSHHLLLLSVFAHPATGRQPVDVVLVQDTQRG